MAETETICFRGTAIGSVERVIHGVKEHVPNRYEETGHPGYDDLIGWAWLGGKKVPLQSGYRHEVMVWEVADDYDEPIDDVY